MLILAFPTIILVACFYTTLKYKRSQQKPGKVFILEKEATTIKSFFFFLGYLVPLCAKSRIYKTAMPFACFSHEKNLAG